MTSEQPMKKATYLEWHFDQVELPSLNHCSAAGSHHHIQGWIRLDYAAWTRDMACCNYSMCVRDGIIGLHTQDMSLPKSGTTNLTRDRFDGAYEVLAENWYQLTTQITLIGHSLQFDPPLDMCQIYSVQIVHHLRNRVVCWFTIPVEMGNWTWDRNRMH